MDLAPFRPDDQPGLLRLLARALASDPVSAGRFTRQVLLDPNFRPEGALVARTGGGVMGFCLALARSVPLENAPTDADRGYLTLIAVDPDHRRAGVGSRLLDAAEQYLSTRGCGSVLVSPYAPGYFIPGVDVRAHQAAREFLLRRGYRELYRPVAMETSLWEWSPPPWVAEREAELRADGILCEAYRPELTLPLLQFARREFPGDWVRVLRETMGRILDGEPTSRLLLAHDGEQVVGFVHHENERFGPIGTAPAIRGRGLGHVLMFRALEVIRERGFRTAWFLWSDDRTARRLYDRAGFREVRRFAVLRKELSV